MKEIPCIRITAGRLLLKRVRHTLNTCRFMGLNIDWIESGGLIEHQFIIRGSEEDLKLSLNELKRIEETKS